MVKKIYTVLKSILNIFYYTWWYYINYLNLWNTSITEKLFENSKINIIILLILLYLFTLSMAKNKTYLTNKKRKIKEEAATGLSDSNN